MKILLLISLTILASASLGERVCKTVSGKLPGMNFALGQSGNLIINIINFYVYLFFK